MIHKKLSVIFLLFLCIFLTAWINNFQPDRQATIVTTLRNYLVKYSGEMVNEVASLREIVSAEKYNAEQLSAAKNQFIRARAAYKKIEIFSSYYFLASGRNFNGPVVPEIEDESEEHPQLELPHGFQQMEVYLWSKDPESYRKALIDEANLMHLNISTLNGAFKSVRTSEENFFEAIQLQVIRTFMLGMVQFDTPECGTGLNETRITFQCMDEVLRLAYPGEEKDIYLSNILKQIKRVRTYLDKYTKLEQLDFLECLRDYYVPLSAAFAEGREHFVKNNQYQPSSLRFNVSSVFETAAFNTFFYTPRGTDQKLSPEAAELGKLLFFDPVMSENHKRACSSCHMPEFAFTDQLPTSVGFHVGEKLPRNAPTLMNVALQRNYFFDSRADNLEGQIGHVLTNQKEMKSNFEDVICKLNLSPEYARLFRQAFFKTDDSSINQHNIVLAIAEYERKLVSLNSRFDKNIRGEEHSFSSDEKKGFNVFMTKARCATCHYLPLFNNLVPPEYTRSEWEILGTTEKHDTVHPKLDADPGRGGLYGSKVFMNAFKTPSLRNISLTGPYMHNGAFKTLEEVIDFYDKGGGVGMGLDVPNQTLPSDSLRLTPEEKKNLLAFMKTLTDTAGLTSRPHSLPSFPDSLGLNTRKMGGEY